MRAVAYLRRSKQGESGQKLGLDAQLDRITAWASYRGAELVARVEDDGVSGGRAPERRPGWQES